MKPEDFKHKLEHMHEVQGADRFHLEMELYFVRDFLGVDMPQEDWRLVPDDGFESQEVRVYRPHNILLPDLPDA
jgi:hypothetical protein